MTLPAFDEGARCPKCSYDAIHTAYWSSGHQGCPAFGRSWAGSMLLAEMAADHRRPTSERAEYKDQLTALYAEWTEHLDRTCARCGFAWSEATVATLAEAVA